MPLVRVLLAAAPHADTFGYSMPPPGLLRLGGELERRGFDVRLEDLAFRLASGALPADDSLAAKSAELLLARLSPDPGPRDLVGLSVMGATLPIALAILEHLRAAAPDAHLALGGPGVGGIDEELLRRFPQVDLVVRGEGEDTVPELLDRLMDAESPVGVAGLTWRDGGEVVREPDRTPQKDLDRLAPYAWHLLPPLERYKAITGEDEGLTPLDSGRGCAYDCSFCSIGRYWSRRSRPLPAARLVEEVLALRDHPGARHAYLCHDLFAADRAHAVAFCEGLIAAGAPVPWEARARADHLDTELCDLMRRAGGYRVLLGVESADPGVRAANQKGMRAEYDPMAAVDACTDAGVTPILSLILGLPGEDEAALARSLDFCADAALRPGVNLSLHLPNPQPGCALGEEHGAAGRPVEGIPPDMAWGAGETAPERALIAAHPDLFSTFALLPGDPERWHALARITRELPVVLMRYPRTFTLLRRARDEGALPLWRAWKATGRSFESFAAAADDPVVAEVLAWEQAQIRAAARGPHAAADLAAEGIPRVAGELFVARHDLAALADALRRGEPLPPAVEPRTHVVLAVPGALAGVKTLRVSDDVARLLGALDAAADERRSLADWDAARPGLGAALTSLAKSGLLSVTTPGSKPVTT